MAIYTSHMYLKVDKVLRIFCSIWQTMELQIIAVL